MELKVYDESLKPKNVQNSNKTGDGKAGDGKRRRGEQLIEDVGAWSNARYKRRNGLLRGMALLKLTTGDDTYIEMTNRNSHKTLKYSSSHQIMCTKMVAKSSRQSHLNKMQLLR